MKLARRRAYAACVDALVPRVHVLPLPAAASGPLPPPACGACSCFRSLLLRMHWACRRQPPVLHALCLHPNCCTTTRLLLRLSWAAVHSLFFTDCLLPGPKSVVAQHNSSFKPTALPRPGA